MRKSINSRIVVYLALVLFATAAGAETGSGSDGQVISLEEAVTWTLERNPVLIAFKHQLDAQDGRVLQAGLARAPDLNISVENMLGSGKFEGTDSAETTLSIAWVLERKIRQRRVDVARSGLSQLSTEADVLRLDAAVNTAHWFLVCLADQARMVNSNDAVRLAEETVAAVQRRVTAGKSPQAELLRARAELARRKLDAEDIEHELLSARHQLAAQWGEMEPLFQSVSGDLTILPTIEPFENLKARIHKNPEYERLLSQKRLNESMLKLAEVERHSGYKVSAGVRRIETTDDHALVADISVPLATRSRNQGLIAEAKAMLAKTEADTDVARLRMETSLFVIYQELRHAQHRTRTLRDEVIPALEDALSETRNGYESGRYSYFEWHSVQNELFQARSELMEASIDAYMRYFEIERLTGLRFAQTTTSR